MLVAVSKRPSRYQRLPINRRLQDVRAALTAVDQQLGRLHFPAQTSSTYLEQFKQIFIALGGTATQMAPLPVTSGPVADRVSTELYNEYVQLSNALLSDTNQVIYSLRSSAGLVDANTSELLRDIEFFQSQATSLHQSVNVGMSKQDLRHEILRLHRLSQGITRLIQQAGKVGRVAQRWEIVLADMQQIGQLMGIAAGPTIDPGQPVLINLPTYHQLPYQVQRPTAAQLSSRAIPLTDQAIAHVDAFVAGFNRFLHLSPRVPALQSQARRLRVLLIQFRQDLASGMATPQLLGRLNQINESLQASARCGHARSRNGN